MASYMFPGLLADWTDGMDPQDPRTMPQGLLAALSQGQGGPDPMGSSPQIPGSQAPTLGSGGFNATMSINQPTRAPQAYDDPFGGDPRFNKQPAPVSGMPMPAIPGTNNPVPSFQAQPDTEQKVGFLEGSPAYQAYANSPSPNAQPAGGAPFNAPGAAKNEPGTLEKLTGVLGGIYGQGGPGDGLINLGLALMSPGNKAENLMRAGQMAQMNDYKKSQLMAAQQKQQREMLALQGNMQTLKKAYPDWSPEQLAAAAQNPALVQEAVKSINPSDVTRPLTDPDERARYGIQPDNKNVYTVDRTGKLTAVGTPTTTTNVNTAVNPILKGLGDQFSTMRDEAKSSADAIRAIHNARSQLDADGGIISGAFANNRIALEKVGSLFDITDPSKVTNTETFLTQIKPQVIAMLKATGTNPSNADRDFAAAMSGADPKLAEQTIRRTLDFNEQTHRGNISRFNDMSGQMLATQPDLKAVAPMMTVQAPDPYQAPPPKPQQATGGAPAAPTAPVRVNTPDEARRLPKGTPIILPDGRQGVVP